MFPANMDVISWLGAFHVKNEVGYSRNFMHAHPVDSICSISIQDTRWCKTHGGACLTECNHLRADQGFDRHRPQPISIELSLHATPISLLQGELSARGHA